MFEYNFFSINDDQEKAQSPYIFIGLGAFSAKGKEYDYDADNDLIIEKQNTILIWRFLLELAIKVRFNYNWILSFETGVRYANVDYIDYNTGKFSDRFNEAIADGTLLKSEFDKRQFGNMSSKDWYVLTGITLTYSFGRPACYCD